MYEGQTVAVVIPAYNEEQHIASVIHTLPDFVDRIYAIDDASTDQTWEALRTAAKTLNEQDPTEERSLQRVIPIRHRENKGAGGAVITGYEHALADAIDIVAVMDGDGQMDPADLERIIAPVARGDASYAKGDRLSYAAHRAPMSRWRSFGNGLLTSLTRIASGYWSLSDPQNGYTAISNEALSQLPLENLYRQYGFLNHVLVHLNLHRERIADVPHSARYGDEHSGIKYRSFVPGLSFLLLTSYISRLYHQHIRQQLNPIVSYYPLGILSLVIGMVSIIAGLGTATDMLLGGLFILFGIHLVLLAVTDDIRANDDLVVTYPPIPPRSPGFPMVREPEPVRSIHGDLAGDGGEVVVDHE